MLLALLAGVALLGGGRAPAEPARPLVFVSYNMFHGGPASALTGDAWELDRRLEAVARELRALGVDVVGLQEASTGRGRGSVPERLAEQLGFAWAHGRATSLVFPWKMLGRALVWAMGFDEGPAIVSRFPIVDQETYRLPVCRKTFDARALLRTALETPWGRLQVYSTHTSHDECQVRRVAEIVAEHRGPLPSIVMGDFNAAETNSWITALRETAGFVDAYRAANPTAPGYTVWQRIDAASPTVFRRVDYVFVVPGTRVPGRVLESRVVLDQPIRLADGRTLWPSDHYGVLARVEVFPPAVTAGAGESPSKAAAPTPVRVP